MSLFTYCSQVFSLECSFPRAGTVSVLFRTVSPGWEWFLALSSHSVYSWGMKSLLRGFSPSFLINASQSLLFIEDAWQLKTTEVLKWFPSLQWTKPPISSDSWSLGITDPWRIWGLFITFFLETHKHMNKMFLGSKLPAGFWRQCRLLCI
jgi:hypothetical protein